ncbi:hypothetical protein [Natrinema sp. CGMCC1.2065]|uniref:hypothetical protein n=1 Tax=Natrinema sp. CGMCC1.2065 TaxID=3445767 RepID=UPI003F49DE09
MRGVAVFISGLFILTAITMFTGVMYEPILEIVANNGAVQQAGLASDATDIADTVLRWMPLMYIAYILVWATLWYFRRERMTAPRGR